MPKKIVVFDHDGTPAHVLYEALVAERYAVHCATQPERVIDQIREVRPDLLLLGWSTFLLIEAALHALNETGDLDSMNILLIGVPDEPVADSELDEYFNEVYSHLSYWSSAATKEVLFYPIAKSFESLEIYEVINLVNVALDRPEKSSAVPAGGLTRTYSYPTSGPPTRPRIQWSLAFPEQVSICRPLLVADHQVYHLDSLGTLCACEAETGEVIWSFSPDREENKEKDERIAAFCLYSFIPNLRSGYAVSMCEPLEGSTRCKMLYELDLQNGQILRSWETPEFLQGPCLDLLPCHWVHYFLLAGPFSSHFFNPGDSQPFGHYLDYYKPTIKFGLGTKRYDEGQLPSMYCHPDEDKVILYGEQMVTNSGDIDFVAIDIVCREETWEDASVLGYFWFLDRPLLRRMMGLPQKVREKEFYEGKITSVSDCNMPIEDETLYLWGCYLHLLEKEGDEKPAKTMLWGKDYDEYSALFALDPMNGAIKWRYESSTDWLWGPLQLVAAAQQIFVIRGDGIEAVDVQTHHQRWQWQANFQLHHALEASGLLYVVGTQGQLVALDISSGETRWTWQVQGEVLGKYSTVDHGTLYVATTQALYALRC